MCRDASDKSAPAIVIDKVFSFDERDLSQRNGVPPPQPARLGLASGATVCVDSSAIWYARQRGP
jgi:hypothetical protein